MKKMTRMTQQKVDPGPGRKIQTTVISPANNGPIHQIYIHEGRKKIYNTFADNLVTNTL